MIRETYKGYLIMQQLDGMFAVSKDGFHIATFTTIASAKETIDMLRS